MKIAYICDENLMNECNRLPTMLNRASIVQDLIDSYQLLKNDKVTVFKSTPATEAELKTFHSTDYISFLTKTNNSESKLEISLIKDTLGEDPEDYGLIYDCPLLERSFDLASTLAGGSLTAAKLLVDHGFDIAVNWFGGWHHAQRDEAEGFCYVNDIVIAIHKLQEKFQRVLYVDLDVHHGNGVQNAFEYSDKVLTVSLHKKSPGFYPGSGSLEEIGRGAGKFFSLNVPFFEGVGDESYFRVFSLIFQRICEAFKPSAILAQCGGDILNGDPIGGCNCSSKGMGRCLKEILRQNLPTIVLGGGGYNFPNTARYWTYLTSIILGCDLNEDIPDCSEYFPNYAPSYELSVEAGNQRDLNDKKYLSDVVEKILEYCHEIEQRLK